MSSAAAFRVSILIVSDRAASGERPDGVLPPLRERLRELGHRIADEQVLPDDEARIAELLARWCDSGSCDLVLSCGGTGLAPRDRTPEATRAIAQRELPGLMELARQRCVAITPFAALSRGLAVTRARTLIVNLPGHPKAALETLDACAELLPHALTTLCRTPDDCTITGRSQDGES